MGIIVLNVKGIIVSIFFNIPHRYKQADKQTGHYLDKV